MGGRECYREEGGGEERTLWAVVHGSGGFASPEEDPVPPHRLWSSWGLGGVGGGLSLGPCGFEKKPLEWSMPVIVGSRLGRPRISEFGSH